MHVYVVLVLKFAVEKTFVIRKLVGYCIVHTVCTHKVIRYGERHTATQQSIVHIYLMYLGTLESNIENKTEIIDGNGVNAPNM